MFGGNVIDNCYLQEAVPNHSDKVCDHANDDDIDVTNHVSDWTTEYKERQGCDHSCDRMVEKLINTTRQLYLWLLSNPFLAWLLQCHQGTRIGSLR